MSEWLWLIIGTAWGIWINLDDAKYYRNIVELQERYIELLHRKIDGEDYERMDRIHRQQ